MTARRFNALRGSASYHRELEVACRARGMDAAADRHARIAAEAERLLARAA
jgi:hypothetical protein